MSKEVRFLHGELQTPPMTTVARVEAGVLLRRVQEGELLSMPQSRPMPTVGPNCHELRVRDADANWRVMYHIDVLAILVLDVFPKTTEQTPQPVIDACKARLATYKAAKQKAANTVTAKRKTK